MFKVDQLSRGRNQPFYSSLIHTKDLPKDHRYNFFIYLFDIGVSHFTKHK